MEEKKLTDEKTLEFAEDINVPDKKELTDEKLVTYMEYCMTHDDCSEDCPMCKVQGCMLIMLEQSLDLIHRLQDENAKQKAEIERLHTLTDMQEANVKMMFENNMGLRKKIERLLKELGDTISMNEMYVKQIAELQKQVDELTDICRDCPYKLKFDEIEQQAVKDTAKEIWEDCIDEIMRGCGDDKEFWVMKILIETFKKYGVGFEVE